MQCNTLNQCWFNVSIIDSTFNWYYVCSSVLGVRLDTMKWNESGFRPLLCTYRLNWARRTSWGWWNGTALQTQDSKFKPWRSETEHVTSRSRRLPTILSFTSGWGRNILVSLKLPRPGNESRALAWKAAVLTTTRGPRPVRYYMCSSVLGVRLDSTNGAFTYARIILTHGKNPSYFVMVWMFTCRPTRTQIQNTPNKTRTCLPYSYSSMKCDVNAASLSCFVFAAHHK